MTPTQQPDRDDLPPRHARPRDSHAAPHQPTPHGPTEDGATPAGAVPATPPEEPPAVPGPPPSPGSTTPVEPADLEPVEAAETAGSTDQQDDVRRTSLGRSSLVMTLGTVASRASGLVRSMLLVACVGSVGAVADAFDIANKLPNMLFALISAGVLQAVLIPQILRAMNATNARERLDKLLSVTGLGLLLLTAVLTVAAPLIVMLYTLKGGDDPAARELAVVFAYWCIPQVFFYGLYLLLGQVLNARGRFAAYGIAPVANNIVSLLGFGAFLLVWGSAPVAAHGATGIDDLSTWSTAQTVLLAGTATLGIAAQAIVLVFALRRSGFRWRFRFGLRGIGLRSAGSVVGWTIGAVVLEQLGIAYLSNVLFAAGRAAGPGEAIAGNFAYTQAMTIYLLPHSLVVVSIVTALFPRMTAAVHAGDLDGVRRDMSIGLRSAGVFSVLSTAALIVLAAPLSAALLPTLGADGVTVVAPVIQAMAPGLIALGATVLVRRMYFAFEDGRSVFVIQVAATVSMVVALAIAIVVLPPTWWAAAAGGAYALSTWISLLLRVRGMSRKLHGMDGARIMRLYVRAAIAAVVAGGMAWGLLRLLGGYDITTWGRSVLFTAGAGILMVLVYGVMLKLLRVRELDDALAPVIRRLRR